MRIAVHGASGFMGKLVVSELRRRGIEMVLVGRDLTRLRMAVAESGAADAELRPAEVDNFVALVEAFWDCDAVINCAGPFTALGERVVRAAISARCHYVDASGEQRYLKRIFDTCATDAQRARVTVVPGMADDGAGDLIAHLTAWRVEPVDELTIGLWHRNGTPSRGTMRTMLATIHQAALRYEDGDWRPYPAASRSSMTFPGSAEAIPVTKLALPQVVTIPRHVPARRVEGVITADLVEAFAAVTPRMVDNLPEGPGADDRRQQKWTIVVDTVGRDGRSARGIVEGVDGYGATAIITVEGARRLVANGAKFGVLAPAQAFNPADFLDFLAPHGVRWRVEA